MDVSYEKTFPAEISMFAKMALLVESAWPGSTKLIEKLVGDEEVLQIFTDFTIE